VLQGKGIKPHRSLDDDLKLTDQAMSYDGGDARRATIQVPNNPASKAKRVVCQRVADITMGVTPTGQSVRSWPTLGNGAPDFGRMTAAERRAYHSTRLSRKFD
jgi:hypothetical protein